MLRNRLFQVSFAMFALVAGTRSLYALTSPLSATNNPAALNYQKGTGGNTVNVVLSTTSVVGPLPANSYFFSVDQTTVPYWLSVPTMTGTVIGAVTGTGATAATNITLALTASAAASTMPAGTYGATVNLIVSGYSNLVITVSLLVKDPGSTLTVTGVLTGQTWALNAAQTGYSVTLTSNNQPISYTTQISGFATTDGGVTLPSPAVTVSPASGLVNTWGTKLTVTPVPAVYGTAKAGDVISGTVTITYANSSSTTTTSALSFSLTVTPPAAAITSLVPATVPVDTNAIDVVSFVINGTGFVSSGTNQVTAVFANGSQIVTGTGITVTVVNSTTILVSITVGTANYFAASGTPLALAVLNPNGASGTLFCPTTPSALANLNVSSLPIINTITSGSAYVESNDLFAPYDLITIFGANFFGNGTDPTLETGTPDGTYFRYPQFLTADSTHYLQVWFKKHSDSTLVGQGYLVFANDTQINVLVPAALATVSAGALVGAGTVDVTVTYGTTTPSTPSTPATPASAEESVAYRIGITANDPGILTINSDGQGQGAILNSDYSLNSNADAAVHATGSVMVYMTGLGAPTSTANNTTSTTALAYPGSCISALGALASGPNPAITGYETTMNTTNGSYTAPSPAWTSVDGAVIQSAMIVSPTYHYAPCMGGVTATINGVAATVQYAGWVEDSIAGLYQVNLLVPAGGLPTGASGATSVPVQVTIGGKSSQAGVTMWVK
jgi:uncharacterized protein (TIGR03437 family)